MTPKRGIKRKDKSRVVLKKGESQRKDGTYDYRWTSRNGRRHSIYAQTLEELRIKEDAITRDEMDGIRAEARCTTLNELFEVWAQVKRGLKDNTYQNYLYVYRQFVAPDFGQSRISSIKKTDIKRFYNMLADQRGLKISTIESVHTVLHQVLTTAVEDNYLRSNPSDNVLRELKKEKEFEAVKRKALTIPEQNLFPTMKPLTSSSAAPAVKAEAKEEKKEEAAEKPVIDFRKVEIEPLFTDYVDFETFSKSDFRAVKILACEAVKKSKKLLKFTLDDGERKDRVILSGIHEYYEPEELVGKTAIAIVNLPPRKMMGIDSEGMLISAVHEVDGHEGLNLLMVDPHIPAGAKLY